MSDSSLLVTSFEELTDCVSFFEGFKFRYYCVNMHMCSGHPHWVSSVTDSLSFLSVFLVLLKDEVERFLHC